jgi:hypothetical protein
MTNDASKAIEERENKAIEFLTRYHKSRTDNSDPLLHLAYSIQELIQIVRWLRIELDNTKCKCNPKMERKMIPLCDCGHSQAIHTAGWGVCSSHNGNDFDCPCEYFTLLERD